MKRLGDSGKNMQFTSAKKGSQQEKFTVDRIPSTMNAPNVMHRAGFERGSPFAADSKDATKLGRPVRERIRNGGACGDGVCVASTYGRGDNDGSKPSPRKKAW